LLQLASNIKKCIEILRVCEWIGSKFGNHSIYIYQQSTGSIIQRIAGLENVILHLAYSPDGR
jgi:hypothetical protein